MQINKFRIKFLLTFLLIINSFFISINAQDICETINGAKIIADDGQYLGKICNPFDNESIINKFGTYGNKFNPNSIWNEFGNYGNEFSNLSPFNEFTNKPPIILKNGVIIGYLTRNKNIKNAVDPYVLLTCEFNGNSNSQRLDNNNKQFNHSQQSQSANNITGNHWISKIADKGRYIILEDKSLWEISPVDIIYTAIWLPISNITIIESKNNDYKYYLINTDEREKVEANFIKR